ncbi:polyprenyl synthetase family protein [Arcanobacterium phocae]|uniref:polyprenyl synthetase family protein n=1 Tax=Arcanobacterium phocae TaxID=131112 RepID=UPI001C0F1839|nr:polyprenyl synthetase family protein [Arcanobacterium phocae]
MPLTDFRANVSARLEALLAATPTFIADGRDQSLFDEFVHSAQLLGAHGKRTRALCVAGGFETINRTDDDLPLAAGVAVELYQISALIHDDIIDSADIRRGVPAAHRLFQSLHTQQSFNGNAELFGKHAALLLGDYLLSLAGEEFARQNSSPQAYRTASAIFHAMTAETAFGQYMDMRAEYTALADINANAINDAFLVLLHKSARYSVELPVLLGAALAGADETELSRLSAFARPLGEAFQLRDDELGIFGNPSQTGKPAGSDIQEGKRTVLIALTRSMCTEHERAFVDSCLGSRLSEEDVEKIKSIITSSGAFYAHEQLIKKREEQAMLALPYEAPILNNLAKSLVGRRW